MSFPGNVWSQLKNKSADDIIGALHKDGWVLDIELRTERIYRSPSGRKVSIHYHTGSTCYGPGLLRSLLDDIGWSVDDMRRLKFVK